jgi:DNA-binding NarL/FixJ family response regulator
MIQRNKEDMTVVGEASNGREAVELWKEHRPDVTLLDLRMPKLDGVDAIKEIRGNDENARIIVLTTFDGDEDIYRAIQAGAKGYLLKDVPREALNFFLGRKVASVFLRNRSVFATRLSLGSVADRRKIHAASMLYHIQNGSVPKLAGTSN